MTTAIDTNVLVALWDKDARLNSAAQKALDEAQARGALVISGAVYAELLALPGRTEYMLDEFVDVAAIHVDWETREGIWRMAGKAFQSYVDRRKRKKEELPRRILADFYIGAHAFLNRYSLLTLDQRLYRAAFPKLEIVTF
ncbi:MAG TPA: PIN domain-containing protein [Silvibacterium sp.]|nr:PIN domain-containing protein [Silvibacterium sp.]